MIPSAPFIVTVHQRLADKTVPYRKNFGTVGTAMAFIMAMQRKQNIARVTLDARILDENMSGIVIGPPSTPHTHPPRVNL